MSVLSRSPGSRGRREEAEEGFRQATEALLREGHSYAELSVGQIAERAGRTRTLFYAYFRDKRDLLMQVTDQVAAALYDEADRWWSGEGGLDDLRAALADILATYHEHDALLRAVVEASGYDDQVAAFWRELVGRFIEATEQRLTQDGVDPDLAHGIAFALVWMTERTCYQHVVRGGRLGDDELVAALLEVWRGAIYSRTASSA